MFQFDVARRSFLGAGGLILSSSAVALLAGREVLAAGEKAANPANDVAILNSALAAELEAIEAYAVGAGSGLLKGPVLALAITFQGHHKQHADVLAGTVKKLGGTPAEPKAKYTFPVETLKTQNDVLRFAGGLEKGAVSAYLGAVPLSRIASWPRRPPAFSATRPCTGQCCARRWARSRCPQRSFREGKQSLIAKVVGAAAQWRPCWAFTITGCS